MGNISIGLATLAVTIQILLSSASPAAAVSADLAKKCRQMAVKAHPREVAGTNPYAQAERSFFRECVSKNGQMQKDNPPNAPPPKTD
jgi:hypothetical protein